MLPYLVRLTQPRGYHEAEVGRHSHRSRYSLRSRLFLYSSNLFFQLVLQCLSVFNESKTSLSDPRVAPSPSHLMAAALILFHKISQPVQIQGVRMVCCPWVRCRFNMEKATQLLHFRPKLRELLWLCLCRQVGLLIQSKISKVWLRKGSEISLPIITSQLEPSSNLSQSLDGTQAATNLSVSSVEGVSTSIFPFIVSNKDLLEEGVNSNLILGSPPSGTLSSSSESAGKFFSCLKFQQNLPMQSYFPVQGQRKSFDSMEWLYPLVKEGWVIPSWHSFQNSSSCVQCFGRHWRGMLMNWGLSTDWSTTGCCWQ